MKKYLSLLFLTVLLLPLSFQTARAAEKPFLPLQALKTPTGRDFWLIEDHAQPLIALSFGFAGAGSVNEGPETQGLARLLSNTLDEGAGPYDSRAFQAELENNAIALSFGVSRDHFYGSLKTLTETRDHAAELLRLALMDPRFETEAVSRMIDANLTRIRSNQPDPDWLAARLMNDKSFAGHPYALNAGGTLSTLPRLTPDMLKQYKKAYLTRDRLKIALAGDITPPDAMVLIDRIFADLPVEVDDRARIGKATLQNAGKTFLFKKDIPQTVLMMAAPAPARDDPDYASFTLLNNILGGSGFGSRLMEDIRERAGLTYGIYSGHSTLDRAALLTIQTSTANENVAPLIQTVHKTIADLAKTGVSKNELQSAQGYLLGSMPMALTSTDSIADLLLEEQMEGRGPDGIDQFRKALQAATPADLARVAQNWLDPKRFVTILIGAPLKAEGVEVIEKINNIE